jgi:hypothetical protein
MNIIELAKQANGDPARPGGIDWAWGELERFADLVEAHEREACAKVCDDLLAPDIYTDTDKSMWDVTCTDCAAAIRARGTT